MITGAWVDDNLDIGDRRRSDLVSRVSEVLSVEERKTWHNSDWKEKETDVILSRPEIQAIAVAWRLTL